jgi:glycosyltransferase involved in cell wall biosynthesis
MRPRRRVLFHRSWTSPTGGSSGGQMKVRDAFEHIRHSPLFEPFVYFGPHTVWTDYPGNVWQPYRHLGLERWEIRPDDLLFFSGMDWEILPEVQRRNPPVPVLHIAQPRHTRPEDKRHSFLSHPAIRIAKSREGMRILEEHGVNGPLFLIPDAIDLRDLPPPHPQPDLDVLIVGLKNQPLAETLYRRLKRHARWRLRTWRIERQVPPALPTRQDFLRLVNRARIVAYLPLTEDRGSEGFYLPALEGMAMGKLVICPYAVGNSDFCLPGVTCLQPEYREDAIFQAILEALAMPESQRSGMIRAAHRIVSGHTIENERESLLNLIHQADAIWNQADLFRR